MYKNDTTFQNWGKTTIICTPKVNIFFAVSKNVLIRIILNFLLVKISVFESLIFHSLDYAFSLRHSDKDRFCGIMPVLDVEEQFQ